MPALDEAELKFHFKVIAGVPPDLASIIQALINAFFGPFQVFGGLISIASGGLAFCHLVLSASIPNRERRVARAVDEGVAVGFGLGFTPALASFIFYLTQIPS